MVVRVINVITETNNLMIIGKNSRQMPVRTRTIM